MPRAGALVQAYRQYERDARGWGVPDFADFRARLYPLRLKRAKSAWSDEDMLHVMALEADGAGCALQRLLRGNPVAAEILGTEPLAAEPVARATLDARIEALVAACKREGWGPDKFGALIVHLDRPGGSGGGDAFAEAFRRGSTRYQRRVREALAAAAVT